MVAVLAWAGITLPGGEPEPEPAAQKAPAAESAEPAGSAKAVPAAERAEVARVLGEIEAGNPLPYDQDGATFQNREGSLPDRPIGYYREYTVLTPGSPDRGARRLVIGDGGETYYTRDHYASFVQIDPVDFR